MRILRPGIFACLILIGIKLAAAELRVGLDTEGEPMTFLDDNGAPAGFAVELFNAIARAERLDVVYVAKPLGELFADLSAGKIDAIAHVVASEERAGFVDFSVHFLELPRSIFVRRDGPAIAQLSDLAGLRIATKPRSAPIEYLAQHGIAYELVPRASLRAALEALDRGEADAVIGPRAVALDIIADRRLNRVALRHIPADDFPQRLHFGVQPGNKRLLAQINEGLASVRADGTYDRLYEKWVGRLEPRPLRLHDLQDYLVPAVLVMSAILGALIVQRQTVHRLAQQKEQLRRSEERLKLVIEGSEDGLWDWDLRTNHIQRSERWASMLGYSLADIAPTPEAGRALVHPADLPDYEKFRARLNTSNHSRYDIEYRMKAKSGEWRWILDRGKVVSRAPDGTPLRMAGTHTDITDLKRARDEARRLEMRFRLIYEHAGVGLSLMEGRRAHTRLVNRAHERITGIPAEQSRHIDNDAAATHPEDRAKQAALVEQLYAGAIDHFSMEKRYLRSDGSIVWAMLNMHLYRDPVTGETHEIGTVADITDLKRAEAEREKLRLKMLETQKLESLGVLAGGIAHDFNNLLTVILANATFVRSDGNHDERIIHIENAARRAADLCRQMLAYAGKGRFVIESVDLGALVRDTTHLLRVSISKKVGLNFVLAPALPPVEADPSQLQQVVMNLVINASDAIGDGSGDVRISTHLARPEASTGGLLYSFDLPSDEDCVCLEIADTGHGMNAATLTRIFDPFFTTKFAGRGLGLAAVLGIVRAHHGALTVESSPGKGSVFRLYLPPARPRRRVETAATPIPFSTVDGQGTILIADDEPIVLTTADKVLRRHGYRTVLASNGHEAVQRFRENPRGFKIVLLDLTMPGLDGAEVLRVIRADDPQARVLIMSGFSEVDVLERLHGVGDVSILHKPFSQEALLARIAEVANR